MLCLAYSYFLDGIEKADHIWVRREILMPRSQWLESKKQKVADGHLGRIVGFLLINADDDMAALQDFFGVLQEGDKGLLRTSIGHLGWTNVYVESTLP